MVSFHYISRFSVTVSLIINNNFFVGVNQMIPLYRRAKWLESWDASYSSSVRYFLPWGNFLPGKSMC